MRLKIGAIALLVYALAACREVNPLSGPQNSVVATTGPRIEAVNAMVNIPALDPASPMPANGPQAFREGQFVTAGARAVDPAGGPFTYAWTASDGRLVQTTGDNTTWYPPDHEGSFHLTVTATTPRGCTITDKLTVNQTTNELVIVPFVSKSTTTCQ